MQPTFGIEEEFVLLDPRSLTAVDRAPAAIAALRGEVTGVVGKEFFPSQVEYASPVFTTAAEALEALIGFRRRLARWADDAGLIAAATGTPFRTRAHADISPDDRYAHIAGDIAGVLPDHQINGMHVHVGIPDRESGVRASNALRVWLPLLLALSSNSPFWHGVDTGFDSWRAIHSRRWTTYGVPPVFADAAEHDATLRALRGIGATSDPGTINWNARLSAHYPTIEVRIFDTPLDPRTSVALAVITRALVASETPGSAGGAIDVTDAALWHAARYGVGETLVDPSTGELVPAGHAVGVLVEAVRPRLADALERELVDELRERITREGSGARRQRSAFGAGRRALGELYRREIAPG
ncbi:YbdK family carboxylate-amine ligase [Microbacterium sp. M3]|uniref:Putative glutamate--cysteine ligase 2 n=1 Tax=Microbacterium arthrosphaerae TaxID=792652 RepID=A0ABU4H761_9MICO|nr:MULTISPECIES: YbdK family carboxylate-amine ligase [Microbacterium]MDW4573709.1 YbdK family carboxylate-amine ligase [Microbacterium arthrosphaerae]MDW7607564.1 YbdK family carboxylate-amine ligase [Microbacterium sp. M3]